jgi:hypothetical protein
MSMDSILLRIMARLDALERQAERKAAADISVAAGQITAPMLAAHAATNTQSVSISGTSTTSAVYVDLAGSSMVYVGSGGQAFAIISILGMTCGGVAYVNMALNINGVDTYTVVFNEFMSGIADCHNFSYCVSLGTVSASNTYKLRWNTSAGTVSIISAQMQIFEFK